MTQSLVGQRTYGEQENSHLEWPDYTGFLAVPESKFAGPLHFKTLMSILQEKRQDLRAKYGEVI